MAKTNTQKLSFPSMLLLGINGIVGSGIFLLPSSGMKSFGPASILILIFDAFLMFMIGLCFAECSSIFSKNGGSYLYANAAFGKFVGYEVGIAPWAVRIIAEATMYVGFATALGGFFPSLNTPMAKNITVTAFAVFLLIINVLGVRLSSVINNIVTVGKLLPILLVIVVSLFFIHPAHFSPFFVPQLTNASSFSSTAMTLFYIFTGVEGFVVSAGAMSHVKKNLPRAIISVLGIVTLIYALIMLACIGVLGSGLVNTSVPIQATLTQITGQWGGSLVAIGSLLSIGGLGVAGTFITPRSMVALSEHGIMPKSFAKTNRFRAPYVSIIVSTVVTLALAYSGTFSTLAQISAVSRFAQYIPTCLAVIAFRKTMPNVHRSYKVPFGYTVPIVAVLISVWLLVTTNMTSIIWGLGALIIAAPFYLVTRAHHTEGNYIQQDI